MEKITIFTPTYNRAYILPNLYKSLLGQTNKCFVWIIVDDGSTDQTKQLVQQWIDKSCFKIEYYKQSNQGKSMAHNKGVSLTKTELFTCVDSDDYLSTDAIENILSLWEKAGGAKCVGILSYKGYANGKFITEISDKKCSRTTLRVAYLKHGLIGDTMLIYKTNVISRFKFPNFGGEKFVPEAYLYDQIDQVGELLILRKTLYYCQYLTDGYTSNIAKLLANNPQGYLAYIKQRLCMDVGLMDRITDTIRYTAMCCTISDAKSTILNSTYPFLTFITYPLGYVFYLKKYYKFTGK